MDIVRNFGGRSIGRAAVLLALGMLLPLQQAWGWNSIGHMAAAYVAYQQLTPAQKTRVAALLALNPDYKLWLNYMPKKTTKAKRELYVFMMAATWPDEIKDSNSGYADDGDIAPPTAEASANTGYDDKVMHKYWHFVDLPFSTDGTALPPVPTPNAQVEIGTFRAAIASDEPDALKSYDLAWLMHLVGDVHQPLHCSVRISQAAPQGDQGGNLVPLTGSPDELHAYWDDLLGNGSTKNYAVALTAAKALPSADPTAAADLSEADWVQESFKLAQSTAYTNPADPAGTLHRHHRSRIGLRYRRTCVGAKADRAGRRAAGGRHPG